MPYKNLADLRKNQRRIIANQKHRIRELEEELRRYRCKLLS